MSLVKNVLVAGAVSALLLRVRLTGSRLTTTQVCQDQPTVIISQPTTPEKASQKLIKTTPPSLPPEIQWLGFITSLPSPARQHVFSFVPEVVHRFVLESLERKAKVHLNLLLKIRT